MKFYDCATAPSPRRVRIFLAEKGLTVPAVQIDLRNGEQFTPAFRALNPDCTVPVLELDSGATITDIIAICRYLEELYPDPPLVGRNAEERAVIESWLRRIEWDGIYAAQEAFRNARKPAARIPCICVAATSSAPLSYSASCGVLSARALRASVTSCAAR